VGPLGGAWQRRRSSAGVGVAAGAMTLLAWNQDARAANDAATTQDDSGADAIGSTDIAGWTLTFDDEFDESSLDFCKWQLRQKWGEKVVNHETEAYVSVPDASQAFTLDNGILHVVARKQKGVYGGVTQPYTSGLLASIDNQKYGYYEIRSRMPSGSGLWPAFWLLHTPAYPDIHEIDIMEWISPSPNVVFMTDHFGTSYATNSLESQVTFSANDFTTAFHIFGLDWEADRISWYADGVEVGRLTAPNTLHDVEMYVVVNLAVGGDLPGSPQPGAIFPASFDVDYVRVFHRDSTNLDGPPPFGPSLSFSTTVQAAAGEECPSADGGALDGESAEGGDAAVGIGIGDTGKAGRSDDASAMEIASSASVRGGCDCTLAPGDRSAAFLFGGMVSPALAIARRRGRSRSRCRSPR
jgi:beta-glucanase (GH16 family)